MGPVMTQFGLAPEVATAANTGDMQAFFKALETNSNTSDNKPDDKKKEDDKNKDDKPKDESKDKKDGDAGMSVE